MSEPRHISQVFFVVANRGGERVAAQLARGLEARGHTTESVGVYRSAEPNADTVDFTVLQPQRPGPLQAIPAWWRLMRHFRKSKPDAVILHTQVAGLLGATAALVAGVKSRVIIHHINVGVSGRFFRPIEAIVGSTGLYTKIVFVGESIREDTARFGRLYHRRSRVIPNAVEVPEPRDRNNAREKFGLSAEDFVIVAIGALADQKNHEVLIRALGDLPEAHLVLAGDGPLRPMLEQLATSTGARVTFLGHIDPEAVNDLYFAADLYAMPSRAEGRSLALLDAVSAGLPVILSDIGQNVEVMGSSAVYCPTEDVRCWQKHLTELVRDPSALASLRSACAEHDIGTMDQVVDAYLESLGLVSPGA